MKALLPGSTIGVLGSGQLGRMLALVGQRMGYRVELFSPQSATPAGMVSNRERTAEYDDHDELARFAEAVDVVTVEFENIPVAALELLEASKPVRPGPEVLHHTQNRAREKTFLARHGLPHATTVEVSEPDQYDSALELVGTPAVLKTAGFGYDGKGQLLIRGAGEREAALAQLRQGAGVLEEFVEFRRELSVIVARSPSGQLRSCGPIENSHRNHILDISCVPAALSSRASAEAREIAAETALALDLSGLICVEFFETGEGKLLINEIAPRPHNSGHLTIEACVVSQFEQQLRAACGLPLGQMDFAGPAAMANLLGDLWQEGEPRWDALLAHQGVALHLYGKVEARPGRKMGHLTALADSREAAVLLVERGREALRPRIH